MSCGLCLRNLHQREESFMAQSNAQVYAPRSPIAFSRVSSAQSRTGFTTRELEVASNVLMAECITV
jgi:hypothetical protein